MKRKNLENVFFWQAEETPKFLFDKTVINLKGQLDVYDFSIIVAVYNAQKYVSETIESIINQKYDFEKIQIILVDDGSTDDSYKVCLSYAKKYPQNIILVHKENGGVSSARNVGMRFAKGKYINFLDSDDMFSSDTFEKVFSFFNKNEKKTDVVAVKVELFGAKRGDTWFNKKFLKGDRVIDLWQEPQIYLNSVSFAFFHSRIKNQLVFDEKLCISEDLKVVNTVLMNKWTLGVLSSCKYYYRIHTVEEASLSSSARLKENWYFTYLDRVYMWLYKKAYAQASCFPEFLQYTLYRDLFNRFNENKECLKVISEERLPEYKEKLFTALSLIDDKIIKGIDVINTDFQLYFFAKKYGSPEITVGGDIVYYNFAGKVKISKRLAVMYENCSARHGELLLEGYLILNNIGIDINEDMIKFSCGDEILNVEFYSETDNDKIAFADEKIFKRKYFRVRFAPTSNTPAAIKPYIVYNDVEIPYSYAGRGRWFGVNPDVDGSYFYENGVALYFENKKLIVKKSSTREARVFEKRFLKFLRQKGKKDKDCLKAYKIRKLHSVLSLFKIRPTYIVSDRRISAGDNGEAFYKFLKKKPFINKYFAIEKNSFDYKRLKKKGFKILQPGSVKFKKKYLMADAIISSHFEDDQLMPIQSKFIPDIIAKKMHIFLQHGITKDDLSSVYSRKQQKFDIFVTCAKPEYDSITENENYFCDERVTKLTGFPRFDNLYNEREKIVLVIPTWRRSLVDHMNHETGEWVFKSGFENTYYYNFYKALFNDERLQNAIKENGYKLVYFPHSNMTAANEYFEGLENVEILKGKDRKYTELFAKSAIMVTDYSSTAFDFAYLRKPVVYCQGDRVEFFGSHTYKEGYFDYERDGFGDVVKSVDEAVSSIIKLIESDCCIGQKYLERINAFFPYRDRNNSLRLFREIRRL